MNLSERKNILNRKQIGIVLTSFALTSVSMAKMMIISGFSDFSIEFSDISLEIKQLLISIASFSGIPVTLLLGKAVLYFSKKKLALFSAVLFTIGGIAPVFTKSFTAIFIARCIMGIGMAMCSTLSTTVIVEHFSGDLRSRLIGYNSAIKSLCGILFSFFGGLLAIYSWRTAYWLHMVGAMTFFVVIICLPKDIPLKKQKNKNDTIGRIHLTFPVWYFSFSAVLMFAFFSVHGNNLSMLFSENGIGSPAEAGTASAIFTFGGFLSGLIFHKIYKRMGEYTQIFGCALAAMQLLLMGFTKYYLLICLECFFFGIAFYLILPHQTLLVTGAVSAVSYTFASAVYLSAINLGQVLSPFILNRLSTRLFYGDVNGRYLSAGCGLVTMSLVGLLREALIRKGKLTLFSSKAKDQV